MGGDIETRLKRFLLKIQDDPKILAVFLFGSVARGEQRLGFDVNICLIFVPRTSDRLHTAQKRLEYMCEAPNGADLRVF